MGGAQPLAIVMSGGTCLIADVDRTKLERRQRKRYLDEIFVPGVPRFMPRSQAEQDPSFKQLIPYVIMMHDGTVLTYIRGKRAGESRLVGFDPSASEATSIPSMVERISCARRVGAS